MVNSYQYIIRKVDNYYGYLISYSKPKGSLIKVLPISKAVYVGMKFGDLKKIRKNPVVLRTHTKLTDGNFA